MFRRYNQGIGTQVRTPTHPASDFVHRLPPRRTMQAAHTPSQVPVTQSACEPKKKFSFLELPKALGHVLPLYKEIRRTRAQRSWTGRPPSRKSVHSCVRAHVSTGHRAGPNEVRESFLRFLRPGRLCASHANATIFECRPRPAWRLRGSRHLGVGVCEGRLGGFVVRGKPPSSVRGRCSSVTMFSRYFLRRILSGSVQCLFQSTWCM
ncbi:hypothetical protein BDY21DRAFT_340094 [Lineolata rhizophorae]|uniref:Uncharacterized protein n=1 Tax=Lineolata rhizophorae TaxID=578093 RepID=A0A6A6P5B9_9PEZI|nr:hypothetical protein BDY21DRAFT_340094 [Lineolata rhizophorae]